MKKQTSITVSTVPEKIEKTPAATDAFSVPPTTAILEKPEASGDKPNVPQAVDAANEETSDHIASASNPNGAGEGEGAIKPSKSISQSIGRTIKEIPTSELKRHPLSDKIYTQKFSNPLLRSIMDHGILQPVLVAKSTMEVIAGNSRVEVARVLNLARVPVTFFDSTDAMEIRQAVLESNQQRIKTPLQQLREYMEWLTIERTLGKARMSNRQTGSKEATASDTNGKARDKAAAKIGMSGVNAEKGAAIVAIIDRLSADTRTLDDADVLTKLLNTGSINAARKKAVEMGHIKNKIPAANVIQKTVITGGKEEQSALKHPTPQPQRHLDGATTSEVAVSEAPVASQDEALGLLAKVVFFLRGQVGIAQNQGRASDWREWHMSLTDSLKALGLEVP